MVSTIKKIKNKYSSINIEAKASIWYTLCNILQKGIAFIVVPIYVRVLSTAEYGRYTTFMTWREILIIFASLNLYCGVFTKAMVDLGDDTERDRYTSSMQGLTTIVSLILWCIYFTFSGLWNQIIGTNFLDMCLLFLYFIMFPAYSFWTVRKKVENKYVSMVVITLLLSVMTPALSLLLLYISDLREEALIRGMLITQIAVGLVFYIMHYIKGRCIIDKKYWKSALRYNIPLIPHYLSLIILGQADRIMIKKICGDDEAGIYSLAYSISTLMNVVIAAVNSSMVPWVYRKLKSKEYGSIYRISDSITLIMGFMTVMLTLCAPELIRIIGTEEYISAVWIIPSVALAIFYTYCYNLYCNIEFYFSKTQYVMFASVIGAILNIVLNLIFIQSHGFIAAGYTTMVCYLVFMLAHFFFMKKVCSEENITDEIFNNRFILFFTVVLSILCLGIQLLYPYFIVRFILIFIVLIISVVKKNLFIDLINIRKEK